MYNNCIKRALDIIISSFALLVLSPLFLIISFIIKAEDCGPIIFKQKRIGKDKKIFYLYKFRSMKTDTPDIPTHLLENPEQYISHIGKFIRKTSIDELPQMLNILKGNMSVVGPRPALWNQDDLIAERDKYGVNSVRPGLTGWAQINGRDELEIPVKARLDGDYVKILNKGGVLAFGMDVKCFLKTIFSVLRSDGVVEGGTSEIKKRETAGSARK